MVLGPTVSLPIAVTGLLFPWNLKAGDEGSFEDAVDDCLELVLDLIRPDGFFQLP